VKCAVLNCKAEHCGDFNEPYFCVRHRALWMDSPEYQRVRRGISQATMRADFATRVWRETREHVET
jgi:hypothetical protein